MPASWEIQFRELRKQFDEKSRKHHRICQQLHSLEGEIFTKKRELEEELFDRDSLIDAWQQDLQVLLEENSRLQEENALLEEIISSRKKRPLYNLASLEKTGHFDEISNSKEPAYAGRIIEGERESKVRAISAFNKKAQPRPRKKRASAGKKADLVSLPFLQLEIFR